MTVYANLKGDLRVKSERGDLLTPRRPLPGLMVQVVVKDGALRGELDVLELGHPPLAELHTVVHQLQRGV